MQPNLHQNVLFKTNNNEENLQEKQRQDFNTTAPRDLFITKMDRPEIHTAIKYLSTILKNTNIDDWKKLRRPMMYLVRKKEPLLRLKVDHLNVLKLHIYAYNPIHCDTKENTVASLSI